MYIPDSAVWMVLFEDLLQFLQQRLVVLAHVQFRICGVRLGATGPRLLDWFHWWIVMSQQVRQHHTASAHRASHFTIVWRHHSDLHPIVPLIVHFWSGTHLHLNENAHVEAVL